MDNFTFKSDNYPNLFSNTNGWKDFCLEHFAKEYFFEISKKIKENYDKYDGELDVYPPMTDIFKAFELTPFQDVKVVIIGQG
jgi:uracil-DNA glycosylase